jgi:putative transposase
MPRRLEVFTPGEYYHIFNRGVNKQTIFNGPKDYKRAIETLKFYIPSNNPLRYSKFMQLAKELRSKVMSKTINNTPYCDILSYCLMPNHFHLLLKENVEKGITTFIRNFQISYTKYFNIKTDRVGPLLQGQFKAVHIENTDQLMHLSRYIHLNPYTSHTVTSLDSLLEYEWSSLNEYLSDSEASFCKKDIILAGFSKKNTYKDFVLSHSGYQRRLHLIKHLVLE